MDHSSPIPDVHKMSFNGRCDSHGWRHKMRPPSRSLASFEIAITGGSATFTRLEYIGVHRQTHTAARFAPFESRCSEDTVEPFLFGLPFDQAGPGDHHCAYRFGDLLSLCETGGKP